MPTETSYNFTISQFDSDALTVLIQTSSIVTALDYISSVGTAVSIYFKDVLSDTDSATLTSLISAYVYVTPTPETQPVSISGAPAVLTTQFERTDINLKMARIMATVTEGVGGAPNTGLVSIQVPGTFGVDPGRYIAGGYGMVDTYDADDFLQVYVSDNDRILCAAMGLATDGTADATVQEMGVLPGALAAFGALPNYPVIKSYVDTDVESGNQGWYFYPLAQGSTLPPVGEFEVEPLGYYGLIPPQLYLCLLLTRPNLTTGALRGNLFWGDSGIN
jgi:hypothetical protein